MPGKIHEYPIPLEHLPAHLLKTGLDVGFGSLIVPQFHYRLVVHTHGIGHAPGIFQIKGYPGKIVSAGRRRIATDPNQKRMPALSGNTRLDERNTQGNGNE